MRTIAVFAGLFVASFLLASVSSAALKREGSDEDLDFDLSEIDNCALGALVRLGIKYEEAGGEYEERSFSMKKRIEGAARVARRHAKREGSDEDLDFDLSEIDDCTLGAFARFALSYKAEDSGYENRGFSMNKRIEGIAKFARRHLKK